MALSITATVGSASANSFVTAAEMTAYCEGRLNSTAWVDTIANWPALVEATRDLSALAWQGWRVTDVQALAWPREYVRDVDAVYDEDVGALGYPEYATTVIPQRVKDATCELALQYLKAGTTDVAMPAASEGVIRKKVDVLETEYAAPGLRPSRGLSRFPRVMALIAPLLSKTSGGLTVVRV